MAAPLPAPPRFTNVWPLLLLVAVTALWPAPGTLLVGMGFVALWSRRAPGLWPWQSAFWDAMQWTVAGAVGIITLGVMLHVLLVRPLLQTWQGGS